MYMDTLDISALSLDVYVEAVLISIADECTMELKPNSILVFPSLGSFRHKGEP